MKRTVLVFFLVFQIFVNMSCAANNKSSNEDTEHKGENKKIIIYCNNSVLPIVKDLVLDFNINSSQKVTYNIADDKNIVAMMNGKEPILFCGYLGELDEESNAIKKELIALDGVAFITGINNPLSNISLESIRNLYINNLNLVNEISNNAKNDTIIYPYTYNNSNIILQNFFNKYIMNIPTKITYGSNVRYVANILDMKSNIKGTNNIGYINFQYVDDDTKLLLVDGIKLTRASLESELYPLIFPVYIYYNKENKDNLEEFIKFLKGEEGKKIIRKYCVEANENSINNDK